MAVYPAFCSSGAKKSCEDRMRCEKERANERVALRVKGSRCTRLSVFCGSSAQMQCAAYETDRRAAASCACQPRRLSKPASLTEKARPNTPGRGWTAPPAGTQHPHRTPPAASHTQHHTSLQSATYPEVVGLHLLQARDVAWRLTSITGPPKTAHNTKPILAWKWLDCTSCRHMMSASYDSSSFNRLSLRYGQASAQGGQYPNWSPWGGREVGSQGCGSDRNKHEHAVGPGRRPEQRLHLSRKGRRPLSGRRAHRPEQKQRRPRRAAAQHLAAALTAVQVVPSSLSLPWRTGRPAGGS